MKRLFVVATMAIMAVGCQKTTVENEVLTPIGFSTDVAKQTRAIVTDGTYDVNVPFAVYSYGYQTNADGTKKDNTGSTPMTNVPISKQGDSWKATTGVYYWPNDASTRLDFYAYSPVMATADITHDVTKGFQTTYTQSDMYVDFMVATPVVGAYYDNQDGGDETVKGTVVPMAFNHQLTQIVFEVSAEIAGVTATIESITLNQIGSKATYEQNKKVEVEGENGTKTEVSAPWGTPSEKKDYTIFPTSLTNDEVQVNTVEEGKTIVKTTPVAMIPQTLGDMEFTIVYKLEGDGVATETVTKDIKLATNNLKVWGVNKKVTYKLGVGLNQITFAPTVNGWEEVAAGDADTDADDIISIL
jgi:hypothetical protein